MRCGPAAMSSPGGWVVGAGENAAAATHFGHSPPRAALARRAPHFVQIPAVKFLSSPEGTSWRTNSYIASAAQDGPQVAQLLFGLLGGADRVRNLTPQDFSITLPQ